MSGSITIGGINLFGTDGNGCSWLGEAFTGWGSTATTLQVNQKSSGDGGWSTQSFRKPRLVGISGGVVGPNSAAVSASLDSLYAALVGSPVLSVDDGGGARTAIVQQQDEVLITWINPTSCDFSFQMIAADPRKLGTPVTVSTGLPSATGGLTIPFTVPFAINSTIVTGEASAVNLGNTLGPVTMRISGPVVGPVVTHVASGLQMVFASSLTLAAGEFIDIDMENKTVLAQGQSSRAQYVTSRGWSGFDVGGNVWAFTAISGTGTLSVTATPAWL